MPTIIRDLPYFDQPTRVQVRGRSFSVKRDQIVVWIGITEKGIQDLDPRTPCFPAILDIACRRSRVTIRTPRRFWPFVALPAIPMADDSVRQSSAEDGVRLLGLPP